MKTLSAEQLEEIVRRLVDGLGPEKIYLFGSYAHGDPHEHSDIDVLIIVPDDGRDRSDVYGAAERCLRWTRVPVELLILTPWEFEQQKNLISSLPYIINKKGTLLYAR